MSVAHMCESCTPRLSILLSLLVAASLALSGCGGGGGGSGDNGGSNGGSTAGGDNGGASSADGSVNLSWVAPSAREDGTAISLSDIDSYEIAYGRESGNYSERVTISDGSATETRIDGLESGTYYFAIRVSDTGGLSSRYSGETSVTVE